METSLKNSSTGTQTVKLLSFLECNCAVVAGIASFVFFPLPSAQMLPDAYCFVWESQVTERFTEPIERAWRVIFDFIVNLMVDGYEIESGLRQRALSLRKIAVKSEDLLSSQSIETGVGYESQEKDNESQEKDKPQEKDKSQEEDKKSQEKDPAQGTSKSIEPITATFPETVPEVHAEAQSDVPASSSNVPVENTHDKESTSASQSEVRLVNENAGEA